MFRVPLLIPAMAAFSAAKLPDWAYLIIIFSSVGCVWILLLEALFSSIVLREHDSNFRSTSVELLPDWSRDPGRPRAWVLDFFLFGGCFVVVAILGYAGAYLSLERLSPKAFTSMASFVDASYFSTVTFATVGYGDVAPVSPEAKILVISQILISLGSIIALVMAYGLSASRSAK